jgi:lysozyme
MNLIEQVKEEEGFKGVVYKCSEGFDTIGYGTRLPIIEAEAELIAEYRLNKAKAELTSYLYNLDISQEAWSILFNMSYQLGVRGVLKFKKMIKALEKQDYKTASKEGLDSLWARQTPKRAKRLMERLSKCY